MPTAERVLAAGRTLSRRLEGLRFAAPVTHVYNPLRYAARPYGRFVRRYGEGRRRILLLGMNPGPFGMAQTGVPFGEVTLVRDWLGIEAPVGQPPRPHPKRPVQGFACPRSEVSGARLWGAIRRRFPAAGDFFREHYVINYCPLVFMEASGRNRTPDKLAAGEREALYAACDEHLRRLVAIYRPEWVIGVGAFARGRAEQALPADGPALATILHPSPANPRANRDWSGEVRRQLRALGLPSFV